MMLRTLFLQAPSFDGFDGGAGARYQARREVKSYWYPTWLAQPAALVENSRLIDAPPHDQGIDYVAPLAKDYDLVVFPNAAHGYGAGSVYMMRRRWDYFVKNLLGAEPPKEYQLKFKGDPRNGAQ